MSSPNRMKKTRNVMTAPLLLKLTFGGITGTWRCLRCGGELPGLLNPKNHKCQRAALATSKGGGPGGTDDVRVDGGGSGSKRF